MEDKQTWPHASEPLGFPWPRQVLLFLQARDGAPPRPAPQKWPEQTEGPPATQPIPHKGVASQDQCCTKPLPISAMPSFSAQAFQAHLALAQVIKGWGGYSLSNSTQASWIKLPWHLSTCIKALGSHADKQGQMGLEEGESGGPATLLSCPPPLQPASSHAAGLRPCSPHTPSSCCASATSTSHWHGE